MKCLLHGEKLTFVFKHYYISYYNCGFRNYQINGVLSFAIMDLAFKIIKEQKRKSITLKKRKPIIHLLNYIDILNFNLNSNKFGIDFISENNYKTELARNLYLYRTRPFKAFAKDSLEVIEYENLCVIRFTYDYASRIQPKNVNLAAMVIHILEKEESKINISSIIFYCVLLM